MNDSRESACFEIRKMRINLFILFLHFILSASLFGSDEAPGDLRLSLIPAKKIYTLGQSVGFDVRFINAGQKSIRLFHPPDLRKLWPKWRLILSVRKPDGNNFLIEPAISFSMVPFAGENDFISLKPGKTFLLRIDLLSQNNDGQRMPSNWIALREITEEDLKIPPEELKKKYGLTGEISYISRGKEYAATQDVIGTVFSEKGEYAVACLYWNGCSFVLEPTSDGEVFQPVEISDAWTGDLSVMSVFRIRRRGE